MLERVEKLADWRTDTLRLRSSYRRLAASRLPVNLYGPRAQSQRRAALLLHGMEGGTSPWEELDGQELADDTRGDRTSVLLGGTTGGVALPFAERTGLIARAGRGTLFLKNIEKLPEAARHILCRVMETGRYTPVGDPYPRPVNCRVIVATRQPLSIMARNFIVEWGLADALGHISLRAETVIRTLAAETMERAVNKHPGTFAAAS
jgi:two-component system, NtrC family, C4-dicarboxylate transport response regulator DctD